MFVAGSACFLMAMNLRAGWRIALHKSNEVRTRALDPTLAKHLRHKNLSVDAAILLLVPGDAP